MKKLLSLKHFHENKLPDISSLFSYIENLSNKINQVLKKWKFAYAEKFSIKTNGNINSLLE